jgi:biopolymer transport protein ExbB
MRKLITSAAVAIAMSAFSFSANAQTEAKNLDQLLDMVKKHTINETADFKRREAAFRANKTTQQRVLNGAKASQVREDARSTRLEAQFNRNEELTVKLSDEFTRELGSLKEVFGVLQQVTGDQIAVFKDSIISAQFPGREAFLRAFAKKTGSSTTLPTIDEMRQLWFEVQREMTQQGKIVNFTAKVQEPGGETKDKTVLRVGTFNLTSGDRYLEWRPSAMRISELVRQPQSRHTDAAVALQNSTSGVSAFSIDPSRGTILSLLIKAPSFEERIAQGKEIGYLILIIGGLGLLLVLERGITLASIKRKVNAQIGSDEISDKNPLGRVLKVYHDNPTVDYETLELKLDEAIMKEAPALERFLTMIKLIAAIAPLMGLLGTVTGMIMTFQAMTLFGTGDPQLMAGGISAALMTTVLGIVVALPMLFLHSVVAGWSGRITHIIEEQAAGIIAVHAEETHKKGA